MRIWLRAGVIGGVSVNFSCLCQTDIKALIAYSLVAHMVLVLCGLILFSWWGLGETVSVIVGHGGCALRAFFV